MNLRTIPMRDTPLTLSTRNPARDFRDSILQGVEFRVRRETARFAGISTRSYRSESNLDIVEELSAILLGKRGPKTRTSTKTETREKSREVTGTAEVPANRWSAFLWAVLPERLRARFVRYASHDVTVVVIEEATTHTHLEQITRVCPHFPPQNLEDMPHALHFHWIDGADNDAESERVKSELRDEWDRFVSEVRTVDPFTARKMERTDPLTMRERRD